jgi:hypothetical protein
VTHCRGVCDAVSCPVGMDGTISSHAPDPGGKARRDGTTTSKRQPTRHRTATHLIATLHAAGRPLFHGSSFQTAPTGTLRLQIHWPSPPERPPRRLQVVCCRGERSSHTPRHATPSLSTRLAEPREPLHGPRGRVVDLHTQHARLATRANDGGENLGGRSQRGARSFRAPPP